MRARIAVLPGRRTAGALRPASGSTSGASSTPVTCGLTQNRARKPVQTQGLARVVTDTVTTLAGEGGAVATPGAREALRPESHARAFRVERLRQPGGRYVHRREHEAQQTSGTVRSSRCADE